jgi:hypothetical protein
LSIWAHPGINFIDFHLNINYNKINIHINIIEAMWRFPEPVSKAGGCCVLVNFRELSGFSRKARS